MSNPNDVPKVEGADPQQAGSEGTDRPVEGGTPPDPLAPPSEEWAPHSPRVHEFSCVTSHLHVAPTCCASSCWCVAEAITRAQERIRQARGTLPQEGSTFYDVVRHTNPKGRRKKGIGRVRRSKSVESHELRTAILNVLHRCKSESDFAVLQVTLREALADVTVAMNEAKRTQAELGGLPPYMGTKDLATFLRTTIATIHSWRVGTLRGPPFYTAGTEVRYKTTEVLEWAGRHVRVGTRWYPLKGVEQPPTRAPLSIDTTGEQFTTSKAAEYLGVPLETFIGWRKRGYGPKYIRIRAKLFLYTKEELDAFRTSSPRMLLVDR